MKRLIPMILCLMSTPAVSGWVTDLSKDAITDERVGFVANELNDSAFSAACVERAGLQVLFYWSHDLKRYPRIELRLDEGQVVSPTVSLQKESGGFRATYLASPSENVQLIEALQQAKKLHVRVLLADGSMSRSVTYDMTGFTRSFRSVCEWHPAYQQLAS